VVGCAHDAERNQGVSIAALAGVASVAAAPACAEADAVARIEWYSARRTALDVRCANGWQAYRTGGAAPVTGFDCSGLVQFSFRQAGVILQHRGSDRPARVFACHICGTAICCFSTFRQEELARRIYVGDGTIRARPVLGKALCARIG